MPSCLVWVQGEPCNIHGETSIQPSLAHWALCAFHSQPLPPPGPVQLPKSGDISQSSPAWLALLSEFASMIPRVCQAQLLVMAQLCLGPLSPLTPWLEPAQLLESAIVTRPFRDPAVFFCCSRVQCGSQGSLLAKLGPAQLLDNACHCRWTQHSSWPMLPGLHVVYICQSVFFMGGGKPQQCSYLNLQKYLFLCTVGPMHRFWLSTDEPTCNYLNICGHPRYLEGVSPPHAPDYCWFSPYGWVGDLQGRIFLPITKQL